MINPNHLAIGILAGGSSSRMGSDKGSLRLPNQQTLLEYMLSKYTRENLVFSSGVCNSQVSGFEVVPDVSSSRLGPVFGIVCSLVWLAREHPKITQCIFIPVDMAYLCFEDLGKLITVPQEIGYFKGSPLPIKINITNNVLSVCHELFTKIPLLGGYSVIDFIRHFASSSSVVDIESSRLINLNYYKDWEKFVNECLL